MALERDGIQLVAEGAAQFIQQMTSVSSSVDILLGKLSATERLRSPGKQLGQDLDTLNTNLAQVAKAAEQFDTGLSKLGRDSEQITPELNALVQKVQELTQGLEAAGRVRTPQITEAVRGFQQQISNLQGQAGATLNATRLGITAPADLGNAQQLQNIAVQLANAKTEATNRQTQLNQAVRAEIDAAGSVLDKRAAEVALIDKNIAAVQRLHAVEEEVAKQLLAQIGFRGRLAQAAQEEAVAASKAPRIPQQGIFPANLSQQRAALNVLPNINAPDALDAFRLRARTLAALNPAPSLTAQQRAQQDSIARSQAGNNLFAQSPAGRALGVQGSGFEASLNNITKATKDVTDASLEKNKAIDAQSKEEEDAKAHSISYLSALSAVHAASFLLANQTFTTAGSLATLGLAASKLGPGFVALGLGAGAGLLALNSLHQAFERLVQIAQTSLQILVAVGAAAGAALAAGFGVAIQQAQGVETEFALVRGVTGATDQQLGQLQKVVVGLSREFGINSKEVASAASLYARAGGDIKDVIDPVNNATRAVIELTTASAGELGAPQAARAIAQITNAFKVGPQEAANFIAGVAQRSSLSFTEVTQAIQQVGPAAANLKIPLIEVGAAIGVAANAGLRGTVAGSGLKQVFLDLAAPSEKGGKLLQQYGISLFDANKQVRPLVDVFGALHRAFGDEADQLVKTGDATRAYALATIFGSRAGQAAAIIAAQGASSYIDLAHGIEAVTATDLANQLLIPTAKQLEITQKNVEALAGAFGGPINAAIGLTLTNFNKFLQTIGVEPFQVAGQAVVALATGQGFGKLGEAIDELTSDPALRGFINDLLNFLLNVRDAVTDQVVPAFVTAGTTIGNALQTINTSKLFTELSQNARSIAQVISIVVVAFGNFVESIIKGDERGKLFIDTVTGIASAIGRSLVAGILLAIPPTVIVIKTLEAVGKAILSLLDDLDKFTSIWEVGWTLAARSVNNFVSNISPSIGAVLEGLVQLESLNFGAAGEAFGRAHAIVDAQKQTQKLVDTFGAGEAGLANINRQLEQVRTNLAAAKAERGNVDILGHPEEVELLERSIAGLTRKEQELTAQQAALQAAARGPFAGIRDAINGAKQAFDESRKGFDLSDIVSRTEGDVTDALSNITQFFKEVQERNKALFDETGGTTPGFLPNEDKIQNLAGQITEFISDTQTKINNLAEDAGQSSAKIVTNGLEKIADATRKFQNAVTDLDDKTKQRLQDIDVDQVIQRAERDFLKDFQRNQEDITTSRGEALSIMEQQHNFELNRERTAQSRYTADLQRDFDIHQEIARTSYDNIAGFAEISFKRAQRAANIALSERQDNESRALTKTLKQEADARQLELDLSKAKTPEERQGLLDRAAQAKKDADFQETQENRVLALKKKHEQEQRDLSDKQELQAFNRRIGLQLQEFQFRLKLEKAAHDYRIFLEDRDTGINESRDVAELYRRFGLARADTTFRRGQQDDLQRVQDQIDNSHTERNKARIRRDAEEQRQILGRNFAEQQARNLREIFEQLASSEDQQGDKIRGIQQNILDKTNDFRRAAEKAGIPLPPEFFQLEALLDQTLLLDAAFKQANDDKRRLFGETLDTTFNGPGGLFENVPSLLPPSRQPQLPIESPLLPASAQVLSLFTGPAVAQAVQQGTYAALQQANDRGILNPSKGPIIVPTGIPQLDQMIQRGLRGTY